MILSPKDMINASTWQSKEEPETVYQPIVSMTRNSFFFFFLVKNLFGHFESVFTI